MQRCPRDRSRSTGVGYHSCEVLNNRTVLGFATNTGRAAPPSGAENTKDPVGLLAVQAQMPVVSSFMENSRHRDKLREMTFAAIEPILGLHRAIQNHYTDVRSGMAARGG